MCSEVRAPRCGLRVCEHRAESIGHSEKKEGEKMEGYDSGKVGNFDALVSATGSGHFGPFDKMTEDDFYKGIKSKMMGQINLVMLGKDHISENGSFTLTSGILHNDPVPGSVGLSFVNGALNSFVIAAANELKKGVRLNVVSPGLVEDSIESLGAYFPGHIPVSMNRMVSGYVKSVEGNITGKIIELV